MTNPYQHVVYNLNSDENALDLDDVQKSVDEHIVRTRLPQNIDLNDFLSNTRFQVEKGDARMNLWEQGGSFRKCRIDSDADVLTAFSLIDKARRAGIKLYWTEKQTAAGSCIMIDLDILQAAAECVVLEKHMYLLIQELHVLFRRLFRAEQDTEHIVHVAVTRKPAVKLNEKLQKFKDGYHIYIYALLTRDQKRYFIMKILEEKIMTKVFGKIIVDAESILDTQCCHVPPLLYGSCKQEATAAYRLWLVYTWTIDSTTCMMQKDDYFMKSETMLILPLELSVNFAGRAIKKVVWTAHDEFVNDIQLLTRKARATTDEDRQSLVDELAQLTITDPDAEYIKRVLECLKPERFNNRKLWFNVVYALVKVRRQYIPLAKLFSKKSDKYTDAGFEQCLNQVWSSTYEITLDTLYYWASKDAPERFRSCNEQSCFKLMSVYVFDAITDGKLGHAHFAEIIWLFLKNKYKTDSRGGKRIWLEFKMPQDPHEPGQVYKWCEVASPDSLNMYLHRKLADLCLKMVHFITKKIKDATEKVIEAMGRDKKADVTQEQALKTYYSKILTAFKNSARGLFSDGFKNGVLKQSETIFNSPGFIRGLDQGLMDLGVGNGILQFSWEGKLPKLIKSFNTLRVSRYTSTCYKQFDPKDPLTRKLLLGLRSMHPDSETDAYEYLMSMMAASIDNRPREAIILLITGFGSNGKSFRFELHQATMEDMYCANLPIAMLLQGKEDSSEAAKPFLMRLETARSSFYEEGPSCAVLNMPVVKRFTGCATLAGRNLHEGARTIKPRCYHFVLSNHDFVVMSHEEAVWRRLRYSWQSMTFKDELEFDASNDKHRLMDRSFNQQFIQEDATRSAYLGIMVFQHMKLMRNYKGVIEHVPHPTIDAQTLAFRNRQDTLNRFITERVVMSPAQDTPTSLTRVIDLYCTWYDGNIKEIRHLKQDIEKQILDSCLKNIIDQTMFGSYIRKGYRVIEDADKREDETPFARGAAARGAPEKIYSSVFPTETPDQYLDRVEREWAEMLALERSDRVDISGTYNYDSDDPDREDGDLAMEFKKHDALADAVNPDNVNNLLGEDDANARPPRYEKEDTQDDELDDDLQNYIS
jgi:phage/plasmid-associated DNA primase